MYDILEAIKKKIYDFMWVKTSWWCVCISIYTYNVCDLYVYSLLYQKQIDCRSLS